MSGTPFTTGQLGKLQNMVNNGTVTALPGVAAKFPDPKRVISALEGRGKIFAGHLEVALEQAIKRMMVLAPVKRFEITISETRDPDAFFQTRPGLWVYDGFRKLVVAKAKPVAAGTRFIFDASEIGQEDGATDEQIEGALPEKHLFDESAVCAIIAEVISKQPQGEEGEISLEQLVLLYLSSCVALFHWGPDGRLWNVDTWERVDRRWNPGHWVLSPAN